MSVRKKSGLLIIKVPYFEDKSPLFKMQKTLLLFEGHLMIIKLYKNDVYRGS